MVDCKHVELDALLSNKHEYDELLRFSVVIPQYNPTIGPQVLENSKGLFLTTKEQILLRQEQRARLKAIEKANVEKVDVKEVQVDDGKVEDAPVQHKKNNDDSIDEQDTFEGLILLKNCFESQIISNKLRPTRA